MGIFQPGGAGTEIYIYDDADATGGHAAGSPHTWAEINAAFPVDFPILQTAAGATFSASHRQYLPNVTTRIGHPASGNSNATSLVDATGADIFCIGTRLQFTAFNGATTTFTLGTKIGTGVRMSGKNGGTIHQSGALVFRGNVGLYGCHIETVSGANNLQFLNSQSVAMEIAGCTAMITGSYIFGNSSQPLRIHNSTFASSTTGNVVASADISESSGVVWAATNPGAFFASAAQNRNITRVILSGSPTLADIRANAGAQGWNLTDIIYSDTASIPKVDVQTDVAVEDSFRDLRTYETKVVDENGNSLSGISVYITTDVDSAAILDDVTDQDGNVVFTWPVNSQPNVLPVREYYSVVPGTTLNRDRIYSIEINGFSAAVPPNSSYETQRFTCTWPGRDRLGSGYQANGGSFLPFIDTIMLKWGFPTTNDHTQWIERVAP